MNDEVVDHLTKLENLAAALALVPLIQDARTKVFETFWENVKANLQARLNSLEQSRWQIGRHRSVNEKDSWLGFVETSDPHANQFCFLFGDLGGCENGHRVYVGIYRGHEAHTPVDAEERIRIALEKRGIAGVDPWWVRFAFLNDVGIRITRTEDDDSVVRANEDNHDRTHPLATRAADLLWDVFEACRNDVEALNENYPYS